MDPPLSLDVLDAASVAVARAAVRRCGAEAGLPLDRTEAACIVVSELAMNQLVHAGGGRLGVRARDGRVELQARDRGPGLRDPGHALRASPRLSLGAGLAAVHRLASELLLDSREGEGLTVEARVGPQAGGPRVAILARPCPGERESGDDALVSWVGDTTRLLVVDGVGHGPPAREAARRLVEVIREQGLAPAAACLEAGHRALRGTRGAVATLLTLVGGELELLGVGNVAARVVGPGRRLQLDPVPGVLGAGAFPLRRLRSRRHRLEPGEALVLATDGLRLDGLRGDGEALQLAAAALGQGWRGHDDGLVLVCRPG